MPQGSVVGLVSLTGLDIGHNPPHRAVGILSNADKFSLSSWRESQSQSLRQANERDSFKHGLKWSASGDRLGRLTARDEKGE